MSCEAAVTESARFMTSGRQELFAVVTRPSVEPRKVGVIILSGGRYGQTAGRNRVSRRLALGLAQQGFQVLRFDYGGIGDSTGVLGKFVLHKPFVDDLVAAVAELERFGVQEVALMGDCFGARTALAAAPVIESLSALLLVSMPWRDISHSDRKTHIASSQLSVADYVRRGLDVKVMRNLTDAPTRRAYRMLATARLGMLGRSLADRVQGIEVEPWVSRRVVRQLEEVRRRGVPTLLLYGTGPAEEYSLDFEKIRTSAAMSAVLGRPGDPIEVRILDQPVAGYRNLVSQDEVIAVATTWLGDAVLRIREAV